MKWIKKMFGDDSVRVLKEIRPVVEKINSYEETVKALTDDDLKAKTVEFKKRLREGETLDDILPEAYAVVREVAFRTLSMRHFDVQLMGGVVLHRGMIAEMKTGEGKTLVATLPVYLNALEEKGVHVVTVNDYLARRDTQWMGQVYDFLGLSVSVINGSGVAYKYDGGLVEDVVDEDRDEEGSFRVFYEYLKPCSRKEAYACDITYGTNNEFGFDYLRDNTAQSKEDLSQRGLHFSIVDEIDSVLIDEARVPLILSTVGGEAEEVYVKFAEVASSLVVDEDYTVDEKLKAIQLTNKGIEKTQRLMGIDNLYTEENMKSIHHLETAVRARALFLLDRDYVIRNGEVMIVDPFTGRVQEGRRWSDGLHQAIEAKEGMSIKQESKTMASITYQNYFKFYDKLSGMTGTAVSSKEEFGKVYGLDVVVVPTNRPIARKDHHDLIFQTEKGKMKAIAKKVKEINETGQPVLIGTVSVEKNELLSVYLKQEGVVHQVLNAKLHEQEGEVVAMAGRKGAVTVATNMAGRGVDIKLGGPTASLEERQEILDLGGLFVLGTERHEARRIDNQLRGRSGRQGDPGVTQFYVSLEDPLMKVFGGDRVKGMIGKLGIPEDEPIVNKFISKQLERAQERIEGFHFDARKHILEFDDVLSYHRDLVYSRRRKILDEDSEMVESIYNEVVSFNEENTKMIESKKEEFGDKVFMSVFRRVCLSVIDRLWMEHLDVMDRTRQSVNLRAYGQREPLVEYKRESLRLFKEMEQAKIEQISNIMARVNVKIKQNVEERKEQSVAQKVVEGMVKDRVRVMKAGEVREVKKKKLDSYLDAGWKVVE